MSDLTHLDSEGRPSMVDVSSKARTLRTAVAAGCLQVGPAQAAALEDRARFPKGDPWSLARIGAVGGVKRCSDLIPLAHPVTIEAVSVDHHWDSGSRQAWVRVEVRCEGRTGVEMEALSGVTTALLVLYDMLKALGQDMTLGPVQLLLKTGGRHGAVTQPLPGSPWLPQAGPDLS